MVREVFSTYRRLSQSNLGAWQAVESWLDETIACLQGVLAQARAACVKLTKDKVKPNQLGFNQKQETPRKILVLLGWSEPEQYFSFAANEKMVQEFEPLTSTSSTSTLQNDKPSANSSLDRTSWDVFNSAILARFVVYAYVLSKYKAFSFYNGSPNGSLQPQAADNFTRKLMRDSWDTESASVRRPGLRRLDNEFRDLQVWLSELSCAWLQSLARRSRLPGDMARSVTFFNLFRFWEPCSHPSKQPDYQDDAEIAPGACGGRLLPGLSPRARIPRAPVYPRHPRRQAFLHSRYAPLQLRQ
jgi:hypothetical protein